MRLSAENDHLPEAVLMTMVKAICSNLI